LTTQAEGKKQGPRDEVNDGDSDEDGPHERRTRKKSETEKGETARWRPNRIQKGAEGKKDAAAQWQRSTHERRYSLETEAR
jgi:hypothetical protein